VKGQIRRLHIDIDTINIALDGTRKDAAVPATGRRYDRSEIAGFSRLLLFCLSAFSASICPAHAEEDLRYPFLFQNRSGPSVHTPAPKPKPPIPVVPLVDTIKPSPLATSFVTILGDSLGLQLGQGLREFLVDRPEFGIVNKSRGNTGLVNTIERDWPKFAREMAALPERNDLTIVLIGMNDNQPLRDETGGLAEAGSDKWRESYDKRIDAMLAPFVDKKIPILWVGLPVVKNARLSTAALMFNGRFRERVQKAGFTYLDIWDDFIDDGGHYADSGPDIAGAIVKLRLPDGIHFTKPGTRKLAFFVWREAARLLGAVEKAPADPADPMAPQATPPQPRPLTIDPETSLPVPDPALPASVLRKPEAGPVFTLTAPPVAAGQLADGQRPRKPNDRAIFETTAPEDVFALGRATYPKPNRGDDFSWPRR
jgi:hypothetical protein